MITTPDPILLSFDGPVATLTLNRPGFLNGIDAVMAEGLLERIREIQTRTTGPDPVRVVVLRGAGTAFCAGGDIRFLTAEDDPAPGVTRLLTALHQALLILRTLPAVVLTSVQGAVAGGGFSLAFMGDLCIAADTTRFTPAYAALGVSPDAGGTIGVVAAVGIRRAMQIYLMEKAFSAEQAERWGLVNSVVPAADLASATDALAQRLAALSPDAVAATKRLLLSSGETPVDEQLQQEQAALIACLRTPAFRQAATRFLGA